MNKAIGIISFPLFLVATGCSSMSALQTARVMPEGDFRILAGGGFFRTPQLSPSDPNKISFPFVEAGGRFGFTPGWDLGVRYTLPGMVTGDVKWQLVDEEHFAFAAGAGLGFLGVASANSQATSGYFTQDIIDVLLPVYFSYDFIDAFGLYASPRFVARFSDTDQLLLGGALGVRVGDKLGLYVEAGGAADLSSSYRQLQVNFGIFFGSGSSVPHAHGPEGPASTGG